MSQLFGELSGPFLETTLQLLKELLSQNLEFREKRAQNQPYAVYYDQVVLAAGTQYIIEQAQSSSEYFTSLFIVFETVSGFGRYNVVANRANATTGFPIPSGASFITIEGQQNIRNFSMMPEAGQTLRFSRALFR